MVTAVTQPLTDRMTAAADTSNPTTSVQAMPVVVSQASTDSVATASLDASTARIAALASGSTSPAITTEEVQVSTEPGMASPALSTTQAVPVVVPQTSTSSMISQSPEASTTRMATSTADASSQGVTTVVAQASTGAEKQSPASTQTMPVAAKQASTESTTTGMSKTTAPAAQVAPISNAPPTVNAPTTAPTLTNQCKSTLDRRIPIPFSFFPSLSLLFTTDHAHPCFIVTGIAIDISTKPRGLHQFLLPTTMQCVSLDHHPMDPHTMHPDLLIGCSSAADIDYDHAE